MANIRRVSRFYWLTMLFADRSVVNVPVIGIPASLALACVTVIFSLYIVLSILTRLP